MTVLLQTVVFFFCISAVCVTLIHHYLVVISVMSYVSNTGKDSLNHVFLKGNDRRTTVEF